MATTPVPVQRSALAGLSTPDSWRSLRSEMDRLFDRFTGGFGFPAMPSFNFESSLGVPVPAVDITEDDAAFKLSAELPGMAEKDIEVALSGSTLTIRGEKRQEKDETKQDYHLTERSYGAFRRAFTLPETVDGEKIAASFDKGVLTVTLPKAAAKTPKTIEVKAAA